MKKYACSKMHKGLVTAAIFTATVITAFSAAESPVMADESGIVNVDGMWYYLDNGNIDTFYTGLCESNEFGLVYVRNGMIDFSYSGIVDYDGNKLCIDGGVFNSDYTGLWSDSASGTWYVKYGEVDLGVNGLVMSDDKWWAVSNGKVADYYTGLWFDDVLGWWFVRNGCIDFCHSGLEALGGNEWCILNGYLKNDYTGIWHDDMLGDCFVKNGMVDSDYTGPALRYIEGYNDNMDWDTIVKNVCYVKDGIVDEEYCGLVKYNNVKFYLRNSRFDNTFSGKVYDSESNSYVYVKHGVPVKSWNEYIDEDIAAARADNPDYVYEENGVNIYIKHNNHEGRPYWIAKVFVEDSNKVGTAMANGGMGNGRQTTSSFAQASGAVFAINASGFSWETSLPQGSAPIIQDGKILRPGQVANMGAYTYHGDFLTPRPWMYEQELMQTYDIKDTFVFGPTLIADGKLEDIPTDAYKSTSYYGRSIVGQVKAGYYVFLVTDVYSGCPGLTLFEARDIMAANNCTYAYNLDAGGSATMVFNGNLINATSDGKEREVSQFIYVNR